MAELYVAKTKGIGGFEKLVAIKVIHPRFSEDEHFVQMLVEEAKITVQLNHVNIAQTFDLGCIDDTYYIAMEYIEGADAFRVGKRAKEKKLPIPIDICCYAAAEVLNGLSYAHRKRDAEGRPLGIVHRDISPQNVLVSYSGEVKLVDFGIAKAALRGGHTEVGVIKGKYYYMSPEQAWGDPVDARTDVFAAGIFLHELLTGEMVYQGDNVPALLDKVRKAEIPSPRARRKDIPEALEAVIMKALAKEASDRYQSAHAFAQDLTGVLYQLAPTFTASRLGQLMATLFPDEVRRNSQILKVPDVAPSEELALDAMSREDFERAEDSVIFDLADVIGALREESEEEEDSTRNDILPFKRKAQKAQPERAARATKEIPVPRRPVRRDDTTKKLRTQRDEWDEETLLKNDGDGWEESTLVDDDGQAMKEVLGFIAARQSASDVDDDEETRELPAEKTVATAGFPFVLPPRPGAAARPIPPPRRKLAEPPPEPPYGLDSMDELPGERTVAAAVDAPGVDLPAEKTVAWGEGAPVPPPAKRGPIAGPSKAGVRLGPEADRFFAPTGGQDPARAPAPPGATFDPFGGAVIPTPPPPPGHDPFVARPQPVAPSEPLGKPEPRRWILPAVLVIAGLFAVIALGTWIAARPKPTSFEIISVPEGATVQIDGRAIAGTTPVTVPDIEPGRTYRVQLVHPGYEPREAELSAVAGSNRSVFLLNQIRVSLRIETRPAGAQVWVDNVLRGSAPLEIPGLAAGQRVLLRSSAPGHEQVTREVVLAEGEREPRVVLELPPVR